MLREADVLPPATEPRLLEAGAKPRKSCCSRRRSAGEARDAELYGKRADGASYLVNVLISGWPRRPRAPAVRGGRGRALHLQPRVRTPPRRARGAQETGAGSRSSRRWPARRGEGVRARVEPLHRQVVLFAAGALGRRWPSWPRASRTRRAALRSSAWPGLRADTDAGKAWRSRGKLDRIARARGRGDDRPTARSGRAPGAAPGPGPRGAGLALLSRAAQVRALQAMLARPEGSGAKGAAAPAAPAAPAKPRRKRSPTGAGPRK